jgi:glycine hydroxymethyltransferase
VRAAITCNKNGIPFDPEKPFVTSGLRLGTPAATTRGFGVAEFKTYARNVVANARALAESLKAEGLDIVSGGTDNHLMLVDLRPKRVNGKLTEKALDRAFITCNKNAIPFDPEKPFVTSGIRLGTPAGTTRGFGPDEFRAIGKLIVEVIDGLAIRNHDDGDAQVEAQVRAKVGDLCRRFPIYP